jgi:hypothetical protein
MSIVMSKVPTKGANGRGLEGGEKKSKNHSLREVEVLRGAKDT